MGHVMPNLYLFDELKKEFECFYIGTNGIEKNKVEKQMKFYEIPAIKLVRGKVWKNLRIPFVLIKSIFQARKILKEISPDVLFSKGGYVALPVCIAAKMLKIPIVAHESDYSFGLANKIILKVCDKMCVNFKNLEDKNKKIVYTGPIFSKTYENKEKDYSKLNIDKNKPTILIVCGSLGSKKINDNIFAIIKDLLKDFNIIHITGKNKVNKDIKQDNYYQIEFAKDILGSREFAEAVVRRAWRWIFGSCNVDDKIIGELATDFKEIKHFNLRSLLYEICTSTAYRTSSFHDGDYQKAITFAAVYPVRRLDAEVLADSIAQITGVPYSYSSVIPEPFSYYHNRAAALPDGSVTDQFLLLFGRPSRDTGNWNERKNEITADQRLYLFNSSDLNNRLQKLLYQKLKKEKDKLNALYLLFYSRMPTKEERDMYNTLGKKIKPWKMLARMPWVLLNSREFLYQH